jgi:D-alanyl-D-alanine endopeptidase (penicillin-binding protein 7)
VRMFVLPKRLLPVTAALVATALWFVPVQAQSTSTAKPKPAASQKSTRTRTSLARAAAAARARTAALARQQLEARTPRYKRDAVGNLVPDVRVAAAIIYNPQTQQVLWEANSRDQRSIASLTKVMTAVTFIADDPDLTKTVTVTRADLLRASVTYLRAGEIISYGDLLHLTLIASDNAAARVLARTSEGGTAAFVTRMNDMAGHLKLETSQYADPSGLDARNMSSAYDLSVLIAFASTDERLSPIMRKASHTVQTNLRAIAVHSTNKLLDNPDLGVLAGKTGFISKAGYCLATLLQVPQGSPVAVVILGATNSSMRFYEALHLFNWVVGRTHGIVGGFEFDNLPHQD